MKLSKIKLAMAASTLLLTSGAYAYDGTINFTGTVITSSCTINTYGSGSANADIDLGTVSTTALSANGQTAAPTPFTIAVTGCGSDVTTVSAQFDGSKNTANTAILASTGTAENVGVAIYNQGESAVLPLNTASTAITLDNGAATMPFTARLYATGKATAGTVISAATFNISYK